jgi:hypothetical protein
VDFFVSHSGQDQAWAEWLAWQLMQAGYTVELDVWDWAPGQDFLARMHAALGRAERLLTVWSPAYFRSVFGGAEMRAAFRLQAYDEGRLVPVRVEPVDVPDLYASLIHVDLVGLDEAAAAATLRARLAGARPTSPPRFPAAPATGGLVPAGDKPAFAGASPVVWNVPARNPHFTGRAAIMSELRRRLRAGEHTVVVQALYGLGGVGKTQLAIEYAHRFPADYELVWWLDAEQPVLLAGKLAVLAGPLGLPTGGPVSETAGMVLAELRRRPGWLLIFDNAQRPQELIGYLPGGPGHVLITSRYPGWGALGGRLEVDVLPRGETVALLRRRLSDELDGQVADQLAAELGDLPLAVAQAAGYLESTGLAPADYLRRFRSRRDSLLARGEVLDYQGRLDTAWTLSVDRLGTDSPAALALLRLAAFLAPEPIPLHLFSDHAELLTEPLRSAAADPDELDDVVGLIVGFSLARRQGERIQLHRLVQAAICHELPHAAQRREADRVLAILAAAHPGDPVSPASWSGYAELAPHVLVTGPAGDDRTDNRRLLLDTARYLLTTGDLQACRTVTEELVHRWREASTLGGEHPDTLEAAEILAGALVFLGEIERARTLGQDTLGRARRVLGPDHPTTLWAAVILAFALIGLGEAEAARALGQDTLDRARRTLGPDHLITLWAAVVLAFAMIGLGEAEAARTLGQDTLDRARRVFDPDHLTTLRAAAVQTFALIQLGEVEPARTLGQDTLDRARRVLGPDHPVTLQAAAGLAFALVGSSEAEPARALGQDTLDRARPRLGRDHLTTLQAAVALAFAFLGLGEAESARALGQDTLDRARRTLGPDHPTTLRAAVGLAFALVRLGEADSARTLSQDSLERCRRRFGTDHSTTRLAAAALAAAMQALT